MAPTNATSPIAFNIGKISPYQPFTRTSTKAFKEQEFLMIPISCTASSGLITEVPETQDFNGSCGSQFES